MVMYTIIERMENGVYPPFPKTIRIWNKVHNLIKLILILYNKLIKIENGQGHEKCHQRSYLGS